MAQEKKIQVTILNTQLDLATSDPIEKEELARELNEYLNSLLVKYPGSNHTLILSFAALKIYEEKKQLETEISKLNEELNKSNKLLQGALYSINNID